MKNLIIIGARGFGREVFNLAPFCVGYNSEFIIKGFLDDKKDALDGMDGYPPIIDSVESYIVKPDDVFICALGDCKWRKHYSQLIIEKGGKFINMISKTAYIGRNTKLGIGCILFSVSISCDINIGNFVVLQYQTIIGHDVQIGDYCSLGTRSFMGGFSKLQNAVTIQTGAIILPHIVVEENATVGAGSVVIRKVKQGITVLGVPAKKIEY